MKTYLDVGCYEVATMKSAESINKQCDSFIKMNYSSVVW